MRIYGWVPDRFWIRQFFSITRRGPSTHICNKICPQRICAVGILYSFSHPLDPLYGRVPERFWHRQFLSITRSGPSTHICNKICPQRICAVVKFFFLVSHHLHPLYGRVSERFWHRQFLSITRSGPSTHICNKICPQRIWEVVRIFYSFSHPLHPLYGRDPERFRHRKIFPITKRGPSTHICNKICPQRICTADRIFIRSRTPFTPYTEGFRSDFGIGNFFLQPKDTPLLISAIKFLPKEYARLIKFFIRSRPLSSATRKCSGAILTSAIFLFNQRMSPY